MFTRSRSDVKAIDWGNGTSERLLTQSDCLGFTVAHTIVRAGSRSALQYRNHLEACYCIAGRGSVESECGTLRFEIVPGVLYALDQHDRHFLMADEDCDLVLVSIFNPPLNGSERHVLDSEGFSTY